jgi:THO complex subunit 4
LTLICGVYIILKGTAEVVFSRRADAENATKRYNNVQLDGNPMKIEIIGTNLQTAVTSNKILSVPSFGNGRGPREM